MPNHMKPEDEHAEQQQELLFYMSILQNIAKLSKLKYAQLRIQIVLNETIEEWKELMSS